jgi:4-aminobutyrate aminotransferase-like enzyme
MTHLTPLPELPPLAPDALPELLTPPPGPMSQAWLRRLKRVESPNVTAIAPDFPVVWAQAAGGAVRDVDGNTYVDGTSAFGVALIGHNHPRVVAAVQQQAGQLSHGMGDVHPPAVRIALLEALQDLAPGDLGHAVLCTGGSEAVEVALKTALLATNKPGVLAFSGSYHGMGHGALDATSRRDFRAPFVSQVARNTTWVPYPNPGQVPRGVAPEALLEHVLARVEEALSHPAMGGMPVGAVLVEPIQGRGGSVVPPDGFLRGLRELCDRHGALLILDEIFTGCGRTGRWFACDHEDVVPDLLCVGKALGGGYPLAACLGRPHVMAAWGESTGEALHTSTFLGHPVACAAALATLTVLHDEQIPLRAQEFGERLLATLRTRLTSPWVADVRGRGLLLGVELRHPQTGTPAGPQAWRTVVEALNRGVILLPCGIHGEVVQLTPPAILTDAQADVLVQGLADALHVATEG